ncbi:translocation/assembly module TamB domain-containing protein [Flavobacterium orientale]|uniref:translocation/assembly module TamB domain-containing protein n=1 Tax=Flavobacterium orientale TaxID=1756020 RepID=UPI001E6253EC|nr:translocation/assembly module TamB domain-containing protein [Flavobacterium orientale]
MGIILLLLLFGVLLSLPPVQTSIANYFTNKINKQYGTDISIDEVAISIFGSVKFKKVVIKDHHKDTLIFVDRLSTKIKDLDPILKGDLIFDDLKLNGLKFSIINYKNENQTNLDVFIDAFDDGRPSSGKFLMLANTIAIINSTFLFKNENKSSPKILHFTQLNSNLTDFKIKGTDVTSKIDNLNGVDFRGLVIKNLKSDFSYTRRQIKLDDFALQTANSSLFGNVSLNYNKDTNDFADFFNRVVFDFKVNSASINTNDIRYFYKELSSDKSFIFNSDINGTLNDLSISNLNLKEGERTKIIGDVNFKNLFGNKEETFYMESTFSHLTSNYKDLTALLPNILGKKLPSSINKLGQFSLRGDAIVAFDRINTNFVMTSDLGSGKLNLDMTNIEFIDNASYSGTIVLDRFAIGEILNRSDVGNISMNMQVDGAGFTEDLINTRFKGFISQLNYNNYNYTGVAIDGLFRKPLFSGKININDPNLFMDFDGLLDVSQKENVYKFTTRIDYADLHKLNFIKTDSISIFKGHITSNLAGNSLDNIYGDVAFLNASYQNNRDIFVFDDFKLSSTFDENRERTIEINSPDIVEGKVVGKFDFNQIPMMVGNALGSVYTNYAPEKVKKGQYLKFNFAIFNKIIEIFYPDISVSKNTYIRGNINSDTNEFKMNFSSPLILANENQFEKIKFEIDNKNPLYNTFIEIDSIKTKHYKFSDFNLLNVTSKDTLFIRSEFKGGDKANDFYNLNIYHTIDVNKNNVVGIQKSELHFKDYMWYLNEEENSENKIIFNNRFSDFIFQNIKMTHEEQFINFDGEIKGTTFKDLNLNFEKVNIGKIIPVSDNLVIEGSLDGQINFKQLNEEFRPYSSLKVENFNVNNIDFGTLNLDIIGDDKFENFRINSSVKNENLESFLAEGTVYFENREPILDLDLKLNKFNVGAFSSYGGEVITNIRGLVSGNASFQGQLQNPEIEGRLYLEDAGLSVPYLGVDYAFDKNSIVDLTQRQFLLRNISMTDSKYKTKGILSGNIRHFNLSDWRLDLEISSDYLNVLDTQDTDDTPYYGNAFIEGTATITGPTKSLLIDVQAKSKKGTFIKIPVSNTQSIGDNSYIRFITKEEKYNLESGTTGLAKNYNGLELNFDLDITEDAEIEVILDKETGHLMKGKGFGTLSMQINTLGKFNMYGDFSINEGIYNFKYRGLVSKQFKVKKYGSIVWDGDPMRARLNIEAVYDNIRANPALLLDNPTVNQKVQVEVVIGITGFLNNPEPDFMINFPTVSSVLKSEIQTKLDDKDTRQTQALYLLASGNFLSTDGGLSQNALSNNLFETFTGVFNDIIKDEEGKMNVGVVVDSADRTPGRETDGSVGLTTSFEINERISVNGKLGVPIGGINDAAVVGDVEILYRVTKDGKFNLRVFNRENDITYIGEGIGYTQGIGATYQVDFDTFKELINGIFKRAKLTRDVDSSGQDSDSDFKPEFLNFINEKKKTYEKPKKEEEKPPEID